MDIVGLSQGSKELPQRQFHAKLRNHILQNREKIESEFYELLLSGEIKKTENGKIEFRMPTREELEL